MRALNEPPLSTKIALAGDWHGTDAGIEQLGVALDTGCDTIVHLGDFGFWPGRRQWFLDDVDRLAGAADARVFFVDGNHEDHAVLRALPTAADGTVPVGSNIAWLPRGLRWEWHGVRFGALGGARSIDRQGPAGRSWFTEEDLTDRDVETLGSAPLDVLLSHDCPAGVELSGFHEVFIDPDDLAEARRVRHRLRQAVETTAPKLVVHGHWHRRHTSAIEIDGATVRVEGLPQQSSLHNVVVLDLPPLALRPNS